MHETAVTVKHHRKFFIRNRHLSARIFFSNSLLSIIFHFRSREFSTKDFKSTKNTSNHPLTRYRPLFRGHRWFYYLFFHFFFPFNSDSTNEGSNPERLESYSTNHTLSIASVNHKILFELKFSLVCSYQPHWNPVYQIFRFWIIHFPLLVFVVGYRACC